MQNSLHPEAFLFPQGVAGYPTSKHFRFADEDAGGIAVMQSLEEADIAFLTAPWDEERLGPPPALTAEQRHCLKLNSEQKPQWLLILNPFTDAEWVTANLKAPIAISHDSGLALQCVQPEPELALRYRWMPQPTFKA